MVCVFIVCVFITLEKQDLVQSCLRGEGGDMVCVYYCRTYYKAVCGGGGGQ
jgi:hypothetical protein